MAKDIEVKKENSRQLQNWAGGDLFTDMLRNFFADWPLMPRRLMSNIQETDEQYVVSAAIPGIPLEEIEVSVSGNVLTIHAAHEEERGAKENESGYQRHSRTFHRSFTLPSDVNAEAVEANCENGLLEIIIPKSAADQKKKIEVRAGKKADSQKQAGRMNQVGPKKESA